MSAFVIVASTIFDESTLSPDKSANAMLPSTIFAEFTESAASFASVTTAFPIVSTPAFDSVASPESAMLVAVLEALPTKIFPLARDVESLLLKVVQSPEVKRPRAVPEASGRLKVCVLPEETMPKSVPDDPVANV